MAPQRTPQPDKDDPFLSPYQMLAWSHEQFKFLEANLNAFSNRVGQAPLVDFDPESRNYLHKIRLSEPLPWQISLIAFDCINAQRACLDHIMYASAAALRLPNLQDTKFPFGAARNREELQKYAMRKEGAYDPAIIDLALSFEPYKDGSRDLLGLNKIRNLKHHRFLVPSSATASSVEISRGIFSSSGADDPGSGDGVIFCSPEWDADKSELTYLRTGVNQAHYDRKITISAAFIEGAPFAGELVPAVLNRTGDIVQKIYAAIKSETERLATERGIETNFRRDWATDTERSAQPST